MAVPQPIHRFCKDNIHVTRREARSPRGTLLLIHGLGGSALCYDRILLHPALMDWTLTAVDLPGYGKSPWAEEPLPIEEFVDLAARFAASIEGPVVLGGHSMGGVIGTLLADRHPELLRGFLNIEGNISRDDCVYSGQIVAHSPEEHLAFGFAQYLDRLYEGGLKNAAWRNLYPSTRFCDPRAIYRNSRELVDISEPEELAAIMGGLSIPALYVAGHPGGTGEYSLGLLRRAGGECAVVPDAGHYVMYDQPDAFASITAKFLMNVE